MSIGLGGLHLRRHRKYRVAVATNRRSASPLSMQWIEDMIDTYRSPDGIRVKALEVNRDGNRELAGAMYNLAALLEGENPPREEILDRLDRDSRNDRRG